MFNFDSQKYNKALEDARRADSDLLMNEVDQVKKFVEKALTMCLESSSMKSKTKYPGVDY